jgi:hypothetical protein
MIMSLKAGSPRYDSTEKKNVLDKDALIGSMAWEIDKQMKKVYKSVKGVDMPDVGKEDRRMLFCAIARGVLKYLNDHAPELIKKVTVKHQGTGSSDNWIHTVSGLDLDIDV